MGASVRDPLHRSAMKGQADVNVKTTTKATSVTLAGYVCADNSVFEPLKKLKKVKNGNLVPA